MRIVEMYKKTLESQKAIIESTVISENDVKIYQDLAKKYKVKLELKERDIEDLEDIIAEYKKELKKPMKYRDDVKSLKADNKYLKNSLAKVKQEYNNLKNVQNHKGWANENKIAELEEELLF